VKDEVSTKSHIRVFCTEVPEHSATPESETVEEQHQHGYHRAYVHGKRASYKTRTSGRLDRLGSKDPECSAAVLEPIESHRGRLCIDWACSLSHASTSKLQERY